MYIYCRKKPKSIYITFLATDMFNLRCYATPMPNHPLTSLNSRNIVPLRGEHEECPDTGTILDPCDAVIGILWSDDKLNSVVFEVAGDELNINRGAGIRSEIVLTLILIIVRNGC